MNPKTGTLLIVDDNISVLNSLELYLKHHIEKVIPLKSPNLLMATLEQEDVDVIGISILSGAHMTIFPRILKLMKEKGIDDVLLTGGGIIPEEDIKALHKMGVGELFTPGAATTDIAGYIKEWNSKNPRNN